MKSSLLFCNAACMQLASAVHVSQMGQHWNSLLVACHASPGDATESMHCFPCVWLAMCLVRVCHTHFGGLQASNKELQRNLEYEGERAERWIAHLKDTCAEQHDQLLVGYPDTSASSASCL